jgi:TRAP-type mannitol/chloroaromatic compound transport system permease small subunit
MEMFGTIFLVILYIFLGVLYGERINIFCGKFVRYLSFALVVVTVYDVLLRYLFRSGSVAAQELEWHIFSALFLLGAAYTFARDEHVRVDVFYSRFSLRVKAGINALGTLLFLLPFTGIVLWASVPFVGRSYAMLERSSDPGGLPFRFLVKGLILLGFALLGLQGLAVLANSLRIVFSPTIDEGELSGRIQ